MINNGLDAPGPLIGVTIGGLALVLVGVAFWPAAVLGSFLLLYAVGQLWASLFGKVRATRRLLDTVAWRGDETMLDVGCGHGVVLIDAARRLTTGRAVGVDVWSQKDQWRNSAAATLANAHQAGVADHVDVKDADARTLPFDDATFDVVTSSLVIHNLPSADDRASALREMARVLKPGGHLLIIDLAHTARYAEVLSAAGMEEVRRSWPLPLFLPTARQLTARRG